MHAATPRIGIQTTIFSEHEVFKIVVIFTLSIFLQKNVKIMKNPSNVQIQNIGRLLIPLCH